MFVKHKIKPLLISTTFLFILGGYTIVSTAKDLSKTEPKVNKPQTSASKPAPKAKTVGKGYGYLLKEQMNFETTLFHFKNLLKNKEKSKAIFILKQRINYLRKSLLKVIVDDGFTEEEKEKIKQLNKIETEWLKMKILKIS